MWLDFADDLTGRTRECVKLVEYNTKLAKGRNFKYYHSISWAMHLRVVNNLTHHYLIHHNSYAQFHLKDSASGNADHPTSHNL